MIKWSIIFGAAASAVLVETIYRKHEGSYDQIFLFIVPLALFVTYGVFRTMRDVDSLIAGMIVWHVFTNLCRLGSTFFILNERPTMGTWAGFVLTMIAMVVSKFWR